ncbi:SDR family NAD(P)-dependent oxidoreductase [Alicyclobacillus sp. ALC3]|uniref:SDR family NAD(P)-dependent oxidoreductase n=1 Tax=Alicyclobacillus sp. ALC3 TaxID=2796143 RepID=UPI0023782BF2|nr:SDR family NAD(P)-dependent oxidoreductase [Alicyclobacillus sp. ALC3]WDL98599.1 SDR family oxidoreductase [Alicyclobacillus sp. ALC3]
MTELPESRPVAVVTGGNTGIGKAVSQALADAGYLVAICFGTDEAGAQALASELRGCAIPVDVTSEQSVQNAALRVLREFGTPQVLVNNAGIQERVPFVELTVEQFDRMMAVNTRGAFLMTKALVPAMMEAQRGKIINISSQTALVGRSEMVHYTASKGALIAMTKSLARELAPYGILVNCVAPGPVTSGPALASAAERSAYASSLPLQRFATPEEVADTVRFLAVGGEYYTGQVLSPNGGEVM